MENTTLSDSITRGNTIQLYVTIPYVAFAICSIGASLVLFVATFKAFKNKNLHHILVLLLFFSVGLYGVVVIWFVVTLIIPSIHNAHTCFFTLIMFVFPFLENSCIVLVISIERHLVVKSFNFGIQEKLNKYKYRIVGGVILFPCVISLTVLLIPYRTETQLCHAPTFFGEYYAAYFYIVFGTVTALGLAIVVITLTTSCQIWRNFFRPKFTALHQRPILDRHIIKKTFTMGTRIHVGKKEHSSHAETREATVESETSQMHMGELPHAGRPMSVSLRSSIKMCDVESNVPIQHNDKRGAGKGDTISVKGNDKRNVRTGDGTYNSKAETGDIRSVKDNDKRNTKTGDIETVKGSNKRNAETDNYKPVKDIHKRNTETGDIETVKGNNKMHAETGDIETVKDSDKRNADTGDIESVKSNRENDIEICTAAYECELVLSMNYQTALKKKCTNIAQNSDQIFTKAADVKYVRHTSWEAKAFKISIMIALLTIFLTGPFVAALWLELYNIPISEPLKFVLNILCIVNYTVDPFLYIWGIPEIKERLIPCRHH